MMTEEYIDILPGGISGTCLLGLGMLAGQKGTTTEIRLLLNAAGEVLSQAQVRTSLHNMAHSHRKEPLVTLLRPGAATQFGGVPGVWELTIAGRAVLAEAGGEPAVQP